MTGHEGIHVISVDELPGTENASRVDGNAHGASVPCIDGPRCRTDSSRVPVTTVVAASTNSISLDTVRSRLLGLQAAQLVVVLSVLAALVFNPTVCLRDVADPRFG